MRKLLKKTAIAALLVLVPAAPASASNLYLDLDGNWSGSYQCSYGKTGLMLEVDAYYDHTMTARADFGPVNGGPDVANGAFTLTGRWDEDGTFVLSPNRWIVQPDGYSMIGFSGKLFKNVMGNFLGGDVTGFADCTEFVVKQ
jgi:hypothetical protein